MDTKRPRTIEQYIDSNPEKLRPMLEEMRKVIQKAAPEATEGISYGIPTFKLNGNLLHFGGYKTHVGFYPGAEAVDVFLEEVKEYKHSKGTIQFPLDKPLPFELIQKITKYKVKINSRGL